MPLGGTSATSGCESGILRGTVQVQGPQAVLRRDDAQDIQGLSRGTGQPCQLQFGEGEGGILEAWATFPARADADLNER